MKQNAGRVKKVITILLLMVAIPAVVIVGTFLFRGKQYAFPVIAVAVLSCIPLFYAFERKESKAGELAVVAVLIALSALGRFLFAWLPGFKPVAAIVVIAGIWLGKEPGFVVGSLSALVSNFYFGQGPWTPFQMFAWGFIGFLAGILRKPLRKNLVFLAIYGAIAGLLYSLLMDVWTVLWADGTFNPGRYFAVVATSAVVMIEYAVSNVIFLLILARPIGRKLERIRTKYGLFLEKGEDPRAGSGNDPAEPEEGGTQDEENE